MLYVVVDGDAARWRPKLSELHTQFFRDHDPLAPVQLEIVDRATHEALERLMSAGLIARTTRGARPLSPEPEAGTPPLTAAESARATGYREHAARRLKLARMMGGNGFIEEARPVLLEAALALSRALAIENRLPEPATLDEVLMPPLSHLCGESLPALREFAADPGHPWEPFAHQLQFL